MQSSALCVQWRSRTFGRPGRWSNLPPFRLRFLKLESLDRPQHEIGVTLTPTKSKFEPDAAKDPTLIADDRYTLAVTLCFSCTQTHMKLTI